MMVQNMLNPMFDGAMQPERFDGSTRRNPGEYHPQRSQSGRERVGQAVGMFGILGLGRQGRAGRICVRMEELDGTRWN